MNEQRWDNTTAWLVFARLPQQAVSDSRQSRVPEEYAHYLLPRRLDHGFGHVRDMRTHRKHPSSSERSLRRVGGNRRLGGRPRRHLVHHAQFCGAKSNRCQAQCRHRRAEEIRQGIRRVCETNGSRERTVIN